MQHQLQKLGNHFPSCLASIEGEFCKYFTMSKREDVGQYREGTYVGKNFPQWQFILWFSTFLRPVTL